MTSVRFTVGSSVQTLRRHILYMKLVPNGARRYVLTGKLILMLIDFEFFLFSVECENILTHGSRSFYFLAWDFSLTAILAETIQHNAALQSCL